MSAGRRMGRSNLTEVSTSALERLRDALASEQLATPLTRSSLIGFGIKHHLDALVAALSGHARVACLAILDVALAERAAHARPAPELVWSGPEGRSATARDTAIVVRDLFESARDHVILGGYSFHNSKEIFTPLHATMKTYGVRATFFIDIEQPERYATEPPERHAEEALAQFLEMRWPFGPPYPTLYYDKRALEPGMGGPSRAFSSQHAKCVVVDGARALISSANFTERAHNRNIEVGVLLDDPLFAEHLARQWLSLIEAGHMHEYKATDT